MRSACLAGVIAMGLVYLEMAWAFAQEAPAARPPAPDWELTDLNGTTTKSSDFHGKVLILDFWATWCAPVA